MNIILVQIKIEEVVGRIQIFIEVITYQKYLNSYQNIESLRKQQSMVCLYGLHWKKFQLTGIKKKVSVVAVFNMQVCQDK